MISNFQQGQPKFFPVTEKLSAALRSGIPTTLTTRYRQGPFGLSRSAGSVEQSYIQPELMSQAQQGLTAEGLGSEDGGCARADSIQTLQLLINLRKWQRGKFLKFRG